MALLELCTLYRALANKDIEQYRQPLATALRRSAVLLLESNQRDEAISVVLEFIGLFDVSNSPGAGLELSSLDLKELLGDFARYANDWKAVTEDVESGVSEIVKAVQTRISPALMSVDVLDAIAKIEVVIEEWSSS